MPVEVLLLAAATGLGSFAVYEACIRPFAVSRFLFGLKPKASVEAPRRDLAETAL